MVSLLKDKRCKLVISHEAGDEGYEYLGMLEQLAKEEGVDMRIVAHRVGRSDRETLKVRKFTHCGISITMLILLLIQAYMKVLVMHYLKRSISRNRF